MTDEWPYSHQKLITDDLATSSAIGTAKRHIQVATNAAQLYLGGATAGNQPVPVFAPPQLDIALN